jgi:predicted outer membrane repeat protein
MNRNHYPLFDMLKSPLLFLRRGLVVPLGFKLAAMLFTPFMLVSASETFHVPDGDVAGLIAALENAKDGDIVSLAGNGVYILTEVNHVEGIDANGLPVIRRAISIEGNGATIERDSNAPDFRILALTEVGQETMVSNLTIKNGAARDGAGMLIHDGSPLVLNCIFISNRARTTGGAIRSVVSSPIIRNSTFERNQANHGGAIYNAGGIGALITGSIFDGNRAGVRGGAIVNSGSRLTIEDSLFKGNLAAGTGGAISNIASSPPILGSLFVGNSATYGGAIGNTSGSAPEFMQTVFSNNTATVAGGGVFNERSSPTFKNCEFLDNWAEYGGGMHNRTDSHPVITDSRFEWNMAEHGGGIHSIGSNLVVQNSLFIRNKAAWRGGGMANDFGQPAVVDSVFADNFADDWGGGMANNNSSPTVTGSLFLANEAGGQGGGMINEGGHPVIEWSEFRGNRSEYGGGIHDFNSNLLVRNSTFDSNMAVEGGGGINHGPGVLIIQDSRFARNRGWFGGGVAVRDSEATFDNVAVEENEARSPYPNDYGLGGGIFISRSTVTIDSSTFVGNYAQHHGGGIANLDGSETVVTHSSFERNVAVQGGGFFSGAFDLSLRPAAEPSAEIGSTSFCANDPNHIAGPWEDLGLNHFGEFCPNTYAAWLHEHFDEEQREDESISGVRATPAGDRIPNLVKFALGLDPWQSYPGALPMPEVRTVEGEGDEAFLTLTFSHPSGLADIDYAVRLSSNLGDWEESAIQVDLDDDGEITTRTYRDTQPVGETGSRFIRLEVIPR